jgi:hypothetical protein
MHLLLILASRPVGDSTLWRLSPTSGGLEAGGLMFPATISALYVAVIFKAEVFDIYEKVSLSILPLPGNFTPASGTATPKQLAPFDKDCTGCNVRPRKSKAFMPPLGTVKDTPNPLSTGKQAAEERSETVQTNFEEKNQHHHLAVSCRETSSMASNDPGLAGLYAPAEDAKPSEFIPPSDIVDDDDRPTAPDQFSPAYETSKWEIWAYYAYYVGNNGLTLFNFAPTAFQNLLYQAAGDSEILHFLGRDRTINSIVLLANGISFAIQVLSSYPTCLHATLTRARSSSSSS